MSESEAQKEKNDDSEDVDELEDEPFEENDEEISE